MTGPDFESAYEEAELERLGRLSPFEYGKSRTAAAKAFRVPLAFLDREIGARRSPRDTAKARGDRWISTMPSRGIRQSMAMS